MNPLLTFNDWLPVIFLIVMGLAMLAYVVLDGYDLGVGILLRRANHADKDMMVSSIGPFWDANETWLVLGVGILLTCFPAAHGIILGELYLPVALMLIALILRGVAFEFRVKAPAAYRPWWDRAFYAGSLGAALSQGWMLGSYIIGFQSGWQGNLFAALIALCLAAGYALLGATWLVFKTEGSLQLQAVKWARGALLLTALGVLAISVATPYISERIFTKWFTLPYLVLLLPLPLATGLLFFIIHRSLARLPTRLAQGNAYGDWVPFASTVGIFILAFYGLAYSLFPYLVIDQMTVWQAATSPEAMKIILAGALIVLPMIIAYTVVVYRIFSGKTRAMSYGN
ncbi:cytochrome d ubiquinol oxidase subunit II [Variovorax sp. PCZ-1]|uniref:cytochrome d ubiquinol oxidase subunit II n=1 Tax=Variovorax sp. PCZ-1 TaxID=2835533 RepID=UPI001BCDDA83|nr:cytochrome d ubiquinol oxidase subunit II [Variovorax sp. PCZ-1]MBS7806466.1 cytochrome d ubiquinol oxidase subunit II [Variovorax sp. PCZ-1]